MSITFTHGATSLTIDPPRYGYTVTVDMALSWAQTSDGPAGWDNGSAYDIRTCKCRFWMDRTTAVTFTDFFNDTALGRGENVTLSLGSTASGFFPAGPDKGDKGDFTIQVIQPLDLSGLLIEPFLHFDLGITFRIIASPSYSIPTPVSEGNFQIGSVSGLQWGGFSQKAARRIAQVLPSGQSVGVVDGGLAADRYTTEFTQKCNSAAAGKLVELLTGSSGRISDINLVGASNYYIYGPENDSSGTYASKLTKNPLEITHDGFNNFSIPLEFALS